MFGPIHFIPETGSAKELKESGRETEERRFTSCLRAHL